MRTGPRGALGNEEGNPTKPTGDERTPQTSFMTLPDMVTSELPDPSTTVPLRGREQKNDYSRLKREAGPSCMGPSAAKQARAWF